MDGGLKRRARLALVPNLPPAPARSEPRVQFCGHCGRRPATPDHSSRVCPSCSLGLLLEARADAAPGPGDAFLVLDSSLSVCAVSDTAERLLATVETDAVNRHVTQLIVPADAEAQGPSNLAVAITWAARGDDATRTVVVRPANTFGVRMSARITSCGPPSAALVVFT